VVLKGNRAGNWLTLEQLNKLVAHPDRSTLGGLRDAVVLGLLAGCGLRRTEAANLTWGHYQERDGRMCLVDIVGKGGRTRTVPVPEWVRVRIDDWQEALVKTN
jgi:site-specific recombinase XerD